MGRRSIIGWYTDDLGRRRPITVRTIDVPLVPVRAKKRRRKPKYDLSTEQGVVRTYWELRMKRDKTVIEGILMHLAKRQMLLG